MKPKLNLQVSRESNVTLKIAELRRLMQESRDLSQVFLYFDDNLGHCAEFLRLGAAQANVPLVNLARAIVRASLSMSLTMKDRMVFIPESQLWHGTLLGTQGIGVLMYFADIDRGCCAVGRFGSPRADFLRFSMPEGAETITDPDSAKLEFVGRRTWGAQPS